MFRDFIDFPVTFAASLHPILAVVGGMTALALAGVLLVAALAMQTPQTQPLR